MFKTVRFLYLIVLILVLYGSVKFWYPDIHSFYTTSIVFVTEENGEAVPGGQERAESVPVAAGFWVLAGQAFSE